MGFKKALFYGGAVLLLAACSNDATAPTPTLKNAGTEAFAKAPKDSTTSTNSSQSTTTTQTMSGPSCSFYNVRTGECEDQPSGGY